TKTVAVQTTQDTSLLSINAQRSNSSALMANVQLLSIDDRRSAPQHSTPQVLMSNDQLFINAPLLS
ncbi:hypothetical protein ABN262_23425, partial [Citrobacter youngae]|uniref:hypothetical protein n=1 Tax=Citrobacter youngae TaxID=133448 RepID=UPI0032D9C28E